MQFNWSEAPGITRLNIDPVDLSREVFAVGLQRLPMASKLEASPISDEIWQIRRKRSLLPKNPALSGTSAAERAWSQEHRRYLECPPCTRPPTLTGRARLSANDPLQAVALFRRTSAMSA